MLGRHRTGKHMVVPPFHLVGEPLATTADTSASGIRGRSPGGSVAPFEPVGQLRAREIEEARSG
jgi:hypothetical protein